MIIVFLIEYIYYIYIFCQTTFHSLSKCLLLWLWGQVFVEENLFTEGDVVDGFRMIQRSTKLDSLYLLFTVGVFLLEKGELVHGLRFFGICALNYAFFLRRRYQWLRLSIFLISTIMTGPFASATHITIISHTVRQSMPILLKTNPGPLLVTSK